jgi:hypothetical protein
MPQPKHTYYSVETSGSSSSSDHSTRVGVTSCSSGSAVQGRRQARAPSYAAHPRCLVSRCFEAFPGARLVYARRTATPNKSPRAHQPTYHVPGRSDASVRCCRARFLFKQRGSSAPAHRSPEQSRGGGSGRGPSGEQQSQESAKAFSAARRSRFLHKNRLALHSARG